jgi:type VI secretion system protein ImpM
MTTPGWYGKLPSQGDFVWRRLPAGFIEPWDAWLQGGIACARVGLGEEAWLARYLVAPIRRFWLSPGLMGDAGWFGLLMPSIDRVGRHFPLTIAIEASMLRQEPTPDLAAMTSLAAALGAVSWLASLDQAARRVLDVDFTVEQFEAELAALEAFPVEVMDDADAVRLAAELLAADAGEAGIGSIWWCEGAVEASQHLRFAALPEPRDFVELLSQEALLP